MNDNSIKIEDFGPEYVGRGQWHLIHTISSKAKNLDQRKNVVWVIETTVNNLRCEICFKHAIQYLKDNPIDLKIYDSLSLFEWTYNFHKSANKHAGKDSPSFEEVRKFYYENNERCTKNCGKNSSSFKTNNDEESKNYID